MSKIYSGVKMSHRPSVLQYVHNRHDLLVVRFVRLLALFGSRVTLTYVLRVGLSCRVSMAWSNFMSHSVVLYVKRRDNR